MDLKYKIENVIFTIDDKVINKLNEYRQSKFHMPESGGLLLGRTDINGNTKIIDITIPLDGDVQSRFNFMRKSIKHKEALIEAKKRCLYFKGNWHTHPCNVANPSCVDVLSWKKTLKQCKPGESIYTFFIIVGLKEIKVWYGNINTRDIKEAVAIKWKEEI